MTRSILCGLLALVSVGALGVLPLACQSGGVGDPCTPEDEYNTLFPGFKVAEENIESRSFQCSTRICLVNHFQGRVSCPYGQAESQVRPCDPNLTNSCGDDATCVGAETYSPECDCDPDKPNDCANACGVAGLTCNPDLKVCTCTGSQTINGTVYYCEQADKKCTKNCTLVLKSYVCRNDAGCQNSDPTDKKNLGKQCCIPGTDTPVTVPVCGQCEGESKRNADNAVYCSCRCCPKCCDEATEQEKAEGKCVDKTKGVCGSACDPNFNYCSCPSGFSCSEIRKNVGLGDAQLTGSYCIKEGTEYKGPQFCGEVQGVLNKECIGTAASHAAN